MASVDSVGGSVTSPTRTSPASPHRSHHAHDLTVRHGLIGAHVQRLVATR